ncbi:MAG: sigma-70 family RNA polymerase sigma factor [Polyangiaceae bacterium]
MEPSLIFYSSRVKDLPRLSEREERDLARRWQRGGDQEARNLLVQSQLSFVLVVARQYCKAGTPLSELVAEGNVGLIHAANKFDAERGCRFFTYAKHWVRVYVSECAIRHSGFALRGSRMLRKARREQTRAVNLLGEGPEARAVMAQRLEQSAEQVDALLYLLQRREVSLESLLLEHGSPDSALCSPESSPEQVALQRDEQRRTKTAVKDAVAALDARERRIVAQRLMADEDTALTLKQLGTEFGVSRERVRQLEERVKQKLAKQMNDLSQTTAAGRHIAA